MCGKASEGGRTESAVEMYETGFLLIVGADTDVDMREAREDLVLRSLSQPERRRWIGVVGTELDASPNLELEKRR